MKKTSGKNIFPLELKTIQRIDSTERRGKISDLFTIWFGSNIMMLSVITGSLAVSMFNLSFIAAVAALVTGNLAGGVFMALHSAQGSQLGVPQMIQTRGQFGSYGALLVVTLVVVMYLGFFASNLVLGGQGAHAIFPALGTGGGSMIIGALSVTAAAFGYKLIHAYTRIMSWLCGLILLLAFVWILLVQGLPADFFRHRPPTLPGFCGAVSIAALWQLAYAPYVSDYSRYMPENSDGRKVFWASYWGSALGSIFPMILGAMIALCRNDGDIVTGLVALTGGASTLIVIVFSLGIAATNAMNLYCATLCALTVGQTLVPEWSPQSGSRIILALAMSALALALAMAGQADFLVNYTHFILLLLYVLIPWTAINLVDYYLIAHGGYHIPSFFRRDGGIYGYVNLRAITCYLLGILVQIPFIATDLYTGCLARMMGGADISWIVGLAVICPVYYLMSKGARMPARSPA